MEVWLTTKKCPAKVGTTQNQLPYDKDSLTNTLKEHACKIYGSSSYIKILTALILQA